MGGEMKFIWRFIQLLIKQWKWENRLQKELVISCEVISIEHQLELIKQLIKQYPELIVLLEKDSKYLRKRLQRIDPYNPILLKEVL
jgi:Tat protein secretion system quality control protein TatD with DNase activity